MHLDERIRCAADLLVRQVRENQLKRRNGVVRPCVASTLICPVCAVLRDPEREIVDDDGLGEAVQSSVFDVE